jgi:hypothetical protein
VTPPGRLRGYLIVVGFLALAAAIVGAGGGTFLYHRIVYGALPLALALGCFGAVAFLQRGDVRRRVWSGVGSLFWLLAIGVVAIWSSPTLVADSWPQRRYDRAHVLLDLAGDRFRLAMFTELTPVALTNCRLERFGEPHDGGYLMCGSLLGSIKTGYSYGISGYDQWGCDVAHKFNVRVHQYDCFNLTQPVCSRGVTVFHPECIGPLRRLDQDGRVFDTLEGQFANNGDGGNRVVVKMDVEGAEWDTLFQAPSDVLSRIDQLVVEFHGLTDEHQLAVIRRLKQFFYVANLHFNNYSCRETIDPFPGAVYEVLFVNKRIGVSDGQPSVRPHPLDAPNDPRARDCQLPVSRWSSVVSEVRRFGFFR